MRYCLELRYPSWPRALVMRTTTWKGLAALLFVPAVLSTTFFYWTRVDNPRLLQVAVVWVLAVFVPMASLFEMAALLGWVAESYARIPIRKRLALFAAAALGISLFVLGLCVGPSLGKSSSYVCAAGAGFMAIVSMLQPPPRLLSVLLFVCTGVLLSMMARG